MEPPPPWPSLTPALPRRAALTLAVVAALPGLALLTYGWGAFFGVGWAIAGLLTARAVGRLDDPGRAPWLIARRVLCAAVLLGFAYGSLTPLLSTDAFVATVWAVGGAVFGVPVVVAWIATARRCLARPVDPATFPDDDARAVLRAALGVAWIGALSCIVADEPLWPLTLAVLAVGVALALRTLRREAAARRWLREVAAGRTAWSLRPIGDPGAGRAWLITPRGESAYRTPDAAEGVAQVVTAPPRRGELALHGVGLALCLLGAAWNHGYVSLPPPARDEMGIRALIGHSERSFIIDRAPPDSVWARVPRHKSLRRLGQYRIPGVDLWRDCKEFHCQGMTVATDERGRVLDTPAVMARLRDRPLLEQVTMRYALMAGRGRPEVRAVRGCGDRVWARVGSYDGGRTEILDFRTGERWLIEDAAHGLDCVAPPDPGGVDRGPR